MENSSAAHVRHIYEFNNFRIHMTQQQRSPFWYLLPIFLGIIGGIIVYFALKNTDKQKAKRALVIGIIISIPLFAWISLQITFGTQNPFYVMATGGMIPALEVYDVMVTQGHVPFEDIDKGDIIVFNRPSDHNRVIVSRVVSIIDDDPKTLRTKGDANPVFREMVKVAITPMISSLSILNYVDMDSEAKVLSYGISLILLNVGMYVGIPASVIIVYRKHKPQYDVI